MDNMPPSARLVGIGFYVAICIAGGALLGRLLDDELGTDVVFTLVGLLLGVALGLWGLVIQLQEVLAAINKGRTEGKRN